MEISGCWRTRDVVRELINASTHVEDKHYVLGDAGPEIVPGKICNKFVLLAVANHAGGSQSRTVKRMPLYFAGENKSYRGFTI